MGTGGSFPGQVMKQTSELHLVQRSNVLPFLQVSISNVGKQCDQVLLNIVVLQLRFKSLVEFLTVGMMGNKRNQLSVKIIYYKGSNEGINFINLSLFCG